jgi:beta-lactamase class D
MLRSFFAFLTVPFCFLACSPNNVTVDNSLQQYFDSAGVMGSFGFFDNGQGKFTIYNLSRYRDSAYQPAATFDILESLIAVQNGVAKDSGAIIFTNDSMAIKVDSAHPAPPGYTIPHTLRECFQTSGLDGDVPFVYLARALGRDTLKKWIDSLQYGNKELGQGDNPFWLNNQLKINSDEQLGLMKKLYFDQLPFFQRSQRIVRQLFSAESNSNYQLYYKLANQHTEDGHAIGWVLGWIEENKHPYFFVVNLESANPNKDLGAAGLSITKSILRQLGFFQGKK